MVLPDDIVSQGGSTKPKGRHYIAGIFVAIPLQVGIPESVSVWRHHRVKPVREHGAVYPGAQLPVYCVLQAGPFTVAPGHLREERVRFLPRYLRHPPCQKQCANGLKTLAEVMPVGVPLFAQEPDWYCAKEEPYPQHILRAQVRYHQTRTIGHESNANPPAFLTVIDYAITIFIEVFEYRLPVVGAGQAVIRLQVGKAHRLEVPEWFEYIPVHRAGDQFGKHTGINSPDATLE